MSTAGESGRAAASEPVAVIGMACRAAGAETPDELWQGALAGRRRFSAPDAGWWGASDAGADLPARAAHLADPTAFDARLFGISPRMAAWMDPQHRIALELAWEALEDAGVDPDRARGANVAVYAGGFATDYRDRMVAAGAADAAAYPGTMMTFVANRISYQFDWTGPSMLIDSACSSGLSAVDIAARWLGAEPGAMALVVAANLVGPGFYGRNGTLARALSPGGEHAPFSAERDGYIRGDGGACVLLKPLSAAVADGDPVHAVIRSVASAHSGRAGGLTGPDGTSIANLILRAVEQSGAPLADIGYVEAHGTGTQAGDAAELSGIAEALAKASGSAHSGHSPDARLWVGSVKGTVGHLEGAAGLIGLVHAILAAQHGVVPPVAGLEAADPRLPTADGRLGIPVRAEPWPPGPRRAVVGSFGLGGAMSHLVIEAGPLPEHRPGEQTEPMPGALPDAARVLPLAARSAAGLARFAARLRDRLVAGEHRDLARIAWTLQSRRTQWPIRVAVIADDVSELVRRLESVADGTGLPDGLSDGLPDGLGQLAPEVRDGVTAWLAGGSTEWRTLWPGPVPARLSLPTVPLERKPYHFDQGSRVGR